jgi:hypothetical protein
VLATIVGGTLRFVAIGQQSFWYDEAVVDVIAARASYSDIFTGRDRDNGNPPLHFLVGKLATDCFGTDEAHHRFLPAVFGTLLIPLISLLGARLHSRQAGAVAGWLLAVSPLQIEVSDEARVYSFLHLITTLNTLLFVRWLTSRSWSDGLPYAAGTAVACYSHYYIVFVIIGHGLVLPFQQDRWRLVGRWCVLMCVAALMWLPWAPAFINQLTTPGNISRMGGTWESQFAATPVVFAVGRTFAWRGDGPELIGVAVLVSLAGYWAVALIGQFRAAPNSRVTLPLLSSWVLVPIVVPLAVALSGTPVYHHRYASVGLPGFLIAVAIGFTRLPPTWRGIAAIVVIASTTYSLANFYSRPIKDDWRSAVNATMRDPPPGRVVLTDSDSEAISFLYYARKCHTVPHELYGLVTDRAGSDLIAIRYQDGLRLNSPPRDYTSNILAAPYVTVVLCAPGRDESAHRSLFARHGFRVGAVTPFYRITIIAFEKGR